MSETRIRQRLILDSLVLAVFLGGLVFLVLATLQSYLPRMRTQQSVKPFEMAMPPMPANVVPFDGGEQPVSDSLAEALANPIEATPEAITKGRAWYRSYCLMCHGDDGKGNTPVGAGYVPKPTDLTSAEVQRRSDGALYRAMTEGKGHEPVLGATVPPDRRWHIVHYVRTLCDVSALTPSAAE